MVRVHGSYNIIITMCVCLNEKHIFCYPPKLVYIYIYDRRRCARSGSILRGKTLCVGVDIIHTCYAQSAE